MSSLLDAAADITRPLGVAKSDQALKWHESDDYPNGWAVNVGYTVEFDDGAASVWIHRAELNTGQRVIELQLNEIDQPALEAEIAEIEEVQRAEDAHALSHPDRRDDGDWAYDRSLDNGDV